MTQMANEPSYVRSSRNYCEDVSAFSNVQRPQSQHMRVVGTHHFLIRGFCWLLITLIVFLTRTGYQSGASNSRKLRCSGVSNRCFDEIAKPSREAAACCSNGREPSGIRWTFQSSGSLPVRRFLEGDRMCGFNYADRRSRSEPAYVDPSLRRRRSCFLTPIACKLCQQRMVNPYSYGADDTRSKNRTSLETTQGVTVSLNLRKCAVSRWRSNASRSS